MKIRDYHAHLYYHRGNIEEARTLAVELGRLYPVPVGTFHEKKVGPHPVWSCQLTLTNELFASVIPWLILNHGTVDLFIHPNTGDDLADHRDHVMWIGKSYDLNLDIF
ncbi:MAG: 4,5-dioxygenase [Zetaproteobacteria bacterium]|nr:4,5-dioxygenase [Pseudobdellovibrionaceae bacterium]